MPRAGVNVEGHVVRSPPPSPGRKTAPPLPVITGTVVGARYSAANDVNGVLRLDCSLPCSPLAWPIGPIMAPLLPIPALLTGAPDAARASLTRDSVPSGLAADAFTVGAAAKPAGPRNAPMAPTPPPPPLLTRLAATGPPAAGVAESQSAAEAADIASDDGFRLLPKPPPLSIDMNGWNACCGSDANCPPPPSCPAIPPTCDSGPMNMLIASEPPPLSRSWADFSCGGDIDGVAPPGVPAGGGSGIGGIAWTGAEDAAYSYLFDAAVTHIRP